MFFIQIFFNLMQICHIIVSLINLAERARGACGRLYVPNDSFGSCVPYVLSAVVLERAFTIYKHFGRRIGAITDIFAVL